MENKISPCERLSALKFVVECFSFLKNAIFGSILLCSRYIILTINLFNGVVVYNYTFQNLKVFWVV